jgi:hypothetical protein
MEISELMQATIIFLVAIQYGIVLLLDKLDKKKKKGLEVAEGGAAK